MKKPGRPDRKTNSKRGNRRLRVPDDEWDSTRSMKVRQNERRRRGFRANSRPAAQLKRMHKKWTVCHPAPRGRESARSEEKNATARKWSGSGIKPKTTVPGGRESIIYRWMSQLREPRKDLKAPGGRDAEKMGSENGNVEVGGAGADTGRGRPPWCDTGKGLPGGQREKS